MDSMPSIPADKSSGVPAKIRIGAAITCGKLLATREILQNLKRQHIRPKIYPTWEEARQDVFDFIERFYNSKRRHGFKGCRQSSSKAAFSTAAERLGGWWRFSGDSGRPLILLAFSSEGYTKKLFFWLRSKSAKDCSPFIAFLVVFRTPVISKHRMLLFVVPYQARLGKTLFQLA